MLRYSSTGSIPGDVVSHKEVMAEAARELADA
jgi:hypothetical protein